MTKEQQAAIGEFFAAVEKLKRLSVIRSDKYLGDIAEFLCVSRFGMELAESGREPGHDGQISDLWIQVKYHGGKSTTVECGDPAQYHQLIIVLGPSSVLRPDVENEPFLVYRIPNTTVRESGAHKDGKYRFTKAQLPQNCLVRAANDV